MKRKDQTPLSAPKHNAIKKQTLSLTEGGQFDVASIIENITDAFLAIDKSGEIIYINKEAEKVLQRKRSNLVGKKITEEFPEILRTETFKPFIEAFRESKSASFAVHYPPRKKWYGIRAYPSKNGQFLYISDITERKQAEELLKEREEQFRLLIEGVRDYALFLLDPQGKIISWNIGAQRITGYKAQEVIGKNYSCFFQKEDIKKKYPEEHLKVAAKKGRYEDEGIRIKKDGSSYWVNTIITALYDEKGNLRGFAKIMRDVTERKQAEEALSNERQRLNNLVANVPGIVWESYILSDTNEQQTNFVSSHAEVMLGYPIKDWLKTPNFWLKIVHPEDKDKAKEEVEEIFKSGKGGVTRYRWVTKAGKPIWVETHADAIHDSSGKPIGLRGVTMDISERMDLERRKDEFISMASHELKTPITSIKGYTQILQQLCKTDEKPKYYLNKMDNQVNRLTILVNDLLDVSRIQSGKLELEKETFEIDALVADIIEDMQQTSNAHKIELKNNVHKKVYADKYRISQVLINLISNAIKFSPKANKVLVTIKAKDNKVLVSIRDYGIGISDKYKEQIFDRFFQATNTIRQSFAGLGLGLYISSEIVKRHNGKIWVDSEKGKGSTFTFEIPIK